MSPRQKVSIIQDNTNDGVGQGLFTKIKSAKLGTDANFHFRPRFMFKKLVIVGVGLIGGSVAAACRKRNIAKEIVGVGHRDQTLQQAVELGLISSAYHSTEKAVVGADFVIVCSPVNVLAGHAIEALGSSEAIVTDSGSTKLQIVQQIESTISDIDSRKNFVASHPIAGGEKSGPEFSDPDLFENRASIVSPIEGSSEQAIETVKDFWSAIGANVFQMPPAQHDQIMASISHLPHMIASVLAASVDKENLKFSGAGFRDTSRIASGNPELWLQICAHNSKNIVDEIGKFESVLASLKSAVDTNNHSELLRILTLGKQNLETLGN